MREFTTCDSMESSTTTTVVESGILHKFRILPHFGDYQRRMWLKRVCEFLVGFCFVEGFFNCFFFSPAALLPPVISCRYYCFSRFRVRGFDHSLG
jgi:hypothetical protein